MDPNSLDALLADALAGNRRALAKLLTVVEEGGPEYRYLSSKLFAAAKGTHTIGLTGAPGAGKSTLTDALVGEVRGSGKRVAVVAVDPSSPFTGGAILGDRVRLRDEHAAADDVFVRSLASRRQLGGLSLAVPGMISALDATGWPVVLVETVGVGQSEVAIADSADTTIVVVNPGWGDEVQANKAGLIEIADIFVVNKADRDGARTTVRDLERMLHLGKARDWNPPIVSTVATDGSGVDELWAQIQNHYAYLESSGELQRRRSERRLIEMRERIQSLLEHELSVIESSTGRQVVDRVINGSVDPTTGGSQMVDLLIAQLRAE